MRKNINELLFTAIDDNNIEALKFLFNNWANIEFKNSNDETPFYYACRYRKIEILKYLIESGANINAKVYSENNNGETPLDLAKEMNYTEIVKLLEDEIKKNPLEASAKKAHEIWSHWMKYYLSNRDKFTQEDYERWEKQSQTPYNKLSEKEKQSDRDVAMKFFNIKNKNEETEIKPYLKEIKGLIKAIELAIN